MNETEALEKIKVFAADTDRLEDTFAYSLSNAPYYIGRFDEDLAETRSYGETLLDHLKGMMDDDTMTDGYKETVGDIEDYSAWFKLNAKVFEFFEGVISELDIE